MAFLVQGGRHDDFELRVAVRSYKVSRDRKGSVALCRGVRAGKVGGPVLLLVAAQRILPDEAGVARVAAESTGGVELGVIPGAGRLGRLAAALPFAALFGFVRVALLPVDDQVAALLGREAAGVAFKGPLLRMDPLVDSEGPPAGAGVRALGTLNGLNGLVLPRVLPQGRLVGAPEVALDAVVRVLGAVFDLDVGLQVAFHGAAVVTEVALVRLFTRVNPDVALQVRVNFELGVALLALERRVASTNQMKRSQKKKETEILYFRFFKRSKENCRFSV